MEPKMLSAEVPMALAEKVDDLAVRLDRSPDWIAKQAIAAWVGQEEERTRLTLEGLADVAAGRVIDHQVVQAWADSLGSDEPHR